jgi:GntR family transcriptional repressor for pyruvate dehydrogenase complex
VKVKPGCGTYIQELSPKDAVAPIELFLKMRQTPGSVDNLYEIRRMIEVEIAGLAAERATKDDYAAMEAAIQGMIAHLDDPEQYTHYDLAFHEAVATATHNDLFRTLLSPIANLWLEVVRPCALTSTIRRAWSKLSANS